MKGQFTYVRCSISAPEAECWPTGMECACAQAVVYTLPSRPALRFPPCCYLGILPTLYRKEEGGGVCVGARYTYYIIY